MSHLSVIDQIPVAPPSAVAHYLPYVQVDHLLFVSGQIPIKDHVLICGKLGQNLSIEQGIEAAKIAALNLLGQVKLASGSFDHIKRCVRLTGYINATPDFVDHSLIINGASDILIELFGEKGRHARSAVGVNSLPMGAAVEIEAIFELLQ